MQPHLGSCHYQYSEKPKSYFFSYCREWRKQRIEWNKKEVVRVSMQRLSYLSCYHPPFSDLPVVALFFWLWEE